LLALPGWDGSGTVIATLTAMVLAVPAHLTIENRDDFRRALLAWIDDAIAHGETDVALDMRETEDLDISGIALLVAVQQRAALHGLKLGIQGANDRVRQMLIVSRIATLFTVE
jgi:anti-anti-sigma regulatory factor